MDKSPALIETFYLLLEKVDADNIDVALMQLENLTPEQRQHIIQRVVEKVVQNIHNLLHYDVILTKALDFVDILTHNLDTTTAQNLLKELQGAREWYQGQDVDLDCELRRLCRRALFIQQALDRLQS